MFGSTEHVGYRRMEGMDHVYVKDSSLISNLQPNETVIGDHKLITMTINDASKPRIGRNTLMNRLNCINNKIKLNWLN